MTADGITDMSEPAGGGGATLTITTPPLAEDAVLAVRTTREVHLGHGTEARGLVHEPFLPVAVRANRAPGLAAGSALVGHGEEGSLEVAASQASARYAVYARPLTDADLFPAGSDPTRTVDIGDRQLTVRSPWPDGRDAALPAGFSVITAPAPGTDGGLALALGPRQEDALLVVTARKDHGGGVTTVVLQPLLAVFVRPDPAPDLRLAALLADGMLAEALLSGGEPGVRYHLRARGARRDASDLPAYFHRPDPADPARHPGVGDLRLGHDLVIARGADAEGRALDPLLPMYRPLGLPVELRVRAVRIGTEAEVQLDATALVAAVPDIGVEPGRLEPGSSATIEVRASVAGEVYEPRRDGAAIAPARPGDGGDLSFETGPLDGDAVFVVAVTELEQAGIAVERRVTLPVEVG